MKKYINYFIPIIYVGVVLIVAIFTLKITDGVKKYLNESDMYSYALDGVFDGEVFPVMKKEEDTIIRPYVDENVKVGRYFYDYEADSKKQENSLILYNNIYMQNTGVDYVSDESFDVVAILSGEIISVEDNDVYGRVISVRHNDNLISVYSNVDNSSFDIGYKVSQGEILGSSKVSEISDDKYMLHFEVMHKGNYIDPENLYTINVSEIQ